MYQVIPNYLGGLLARVMHAGLGCACCVVVVQFGAILLPEINPALLIGALISPPTTQPASQLAEPTPTFAGLNEDFKKLCARAPVCSVAKGRASLELLWAWGFGRSRPEP